jgi:hypothetical protein
VTAGRTASQPELYDAWTARLRAARDRLQAIRDAAEVAEQERDQTIVGAFEAGLPVTPIQYATGLTSTRCYQIRAGRRT